MLTHAWTTDERVICGTEDGKIYIFESSGELKFEVTHVQSSSQVPRSVNVMISFSKGILVGSSGGSVTIYEKGEDLSLLAAAGGNATSVSANRDALRKTREFNLIEDVSAIVKLAISPTDEFFLCTTEKSQLYCASLTSNEVKVWAFI